MKKKLWLAAFMALLCCMLFAIGASAATEGSYTYTVTDGKATITAVSNDLYLNGDVVVPSTLGGYPVTAIGDYAFASCPLESLTIPADIDSLGEGAFYCCTALKNLTLEEGVSSVGAYAFYGCTALESVVIPASITSMGSGMFAYCSALEEVTLVPGLTALGYGMFSTCTALESISIPDGITSIGDYAFENCWELKTANIPETVTSIGNSAFYSTALTSIHIPDSTNFIGEDAFFSCTALKELTIEEGVTTVGDFAFNNCTSLESVVIPASITSMGTGMFAYCSSLEEVTLAPGLTTLGYGMFSTCTALESISIPDSVTSIGGYAFQKCSSLQSVTIPDSVSSLGEKLFDGMSGVTAYVGEGSAAEAYMKDAKIDYETVAQTPAILVQAQSVRAKVGETAALFVVSSVKDGILTYQWYVSDNAEGPFSPIPGATQAAYVPDTSAAGVKFYYVSVTNTNNDATGTKTAVTQSAMSSVTVGQVSGCTVSGKLFTSGDASDVTIELLLNGKVEYTCTVEDTTGEAQYAIEGVTPGIYTMRVSKEKHVTREYTVTVQP